MDATDGQRIRAALREHGVPPEVAQISQSLATAAGLVADLPQQVEQARAGGTRQARQAVQERLDQLVEWYATAEASSQELMQAAEAIDETERHSYQHIRNLVSLQATQAWVDMVAPFGLQLGIRLRAGIDAIKESGFREGLRGVAEAIAGAHRAAEAARDAWQDEATNGADFDREWPHRTRFVAMQVTADGALLEAIVIAIRYAGSKPDLSPLAHPTWQANEPTLVVTYRVVPGDRACTEADLTAALETDGVQLRHTSAGLGAVITSPDPNAHSAIKATITQLGYEVVGTDIRWADQASSLASQSTDDD